MKTLVDYARAQRYLGRRDPVLKQVMSKVGPCSLRINRDHFVVLTKSIVSQQLSTKAAATIHSRLVLALAGEALTPTSLLQLSEEALVSAGLSRAKRVALRDLATKIHTKEVILHDIQSLSDDKLIERLVQVKGIGRWTAEMFLIFSLGRLDVLPVADLGLRAAVHRQYGLDELPDKNQLEELGDRWRPYRSIATWYLWRSQGFLPEPTK
ncbi:MAG: DNA-3-methyladenine glycosylase family protein [Gemmataceae bacterium]